MENYDDRVNFEDLLLHCQLQAKRVKNLARSAKLFSSHASMQSEKVQSITKNSAVSIHKDLKGVEDAETAQIVTKLNSLIPNQEQKSFKKFTKDFSRPKKQKSLNFDSKIGMPTLPVAGSSDLSEEASDSDSEFYPDWTSIESFTSSLSRGSLGEGRSSLIFEGLQSPDDVLFEDDDGLHLSDDDEFDALAKSRRDGAAVECKVKYENFSTGSDTELEDQKVMLDYYSGTRQPIPAAGNDKPGTSQPPNLVKPGPSSECVKAPALRRVKSMILDTDLEDGMQVGKRMFVLQQKRQIDTQGAHLSPLLSEQDVTLKKCHSQVTASARYSMKRSRSNLSCNNPLSYQRGVPKPPPEGTITEEDETEN